MTKEIMTKELAKQTLNEILDYYECSEESLDTNYENLFLMIKNGRLEFCEDKTFNLKLFTKIKNSEGIEIDSVHLKVLTGQILIDGEKNKKNDVEVGLYYISRSANLLLGNIFDMTTKDIKNANAVLSLFL